jgi:hypothetical protein
MRLGRRIHDLIEGLEFLAERTLISTKRRHKETECELRRQPCWPTSVVEKEEDEMQKMFKRHPKMSTDNEWTSNKVVSDLWTFA